MIHQEIQPGSRPLKGEKQNSGGGLTAAVCFQESNRSRCKRITFGDKLSDTQTWIAETQICWDSQLMKGKQSRILSLMQNNVE